MKPVFIILARLGGQQATAILQYLPPPPHLTFYVVAEAQTLVLTLAQQELLLTLPSPQLLKTISNLWKEKT